MSLQWCYDTGGNLHSAKAGWELFGFIFYLAVAVCVKAHLNKV